MARLMLLVCLRLGLVLAHGQEGSSIAEALEYAPLSEILAPLPEILGGRGLKQAGATGGAPEVTLPPTAAATLPAEVLPLEFTPIPEFVRGARGLKQVEPTATTPMAAPTVAAPTVAVPVVALPLEFVPLPELSRARAVRGLKQVEPTAPLVTVPPAALPLEYIPVPELIRTVRGLKQAGDQVIGYPALEAQLVAEVGAPRAETLLPPPKGNGRR